MFRDNVVIWKTQIKIPYGKSQNTADSRHEIVMGFHSDSGKAEAVARGAPES